MNTQQPSDDQHSLDRYRAVADFVRLRDFLILGAVVLLAASVFVVGLLVLLRILP